MRYLPLMVVLWACAALPSAEDVQAADIGDPPGQEVAERAAAMAIRQHLKDPDSARMSFGMLSRSYYLISRFKPPRFAWGLRVTVNAKNSYGGYTGPMDYEAYFLERGIVGLAIPHRTASRYGESTYYVIVEMNGGGVPGPQALAR